MWPVILSSFEIKSQVKRFSNETSTGISNTWIPWWESTSDPRIWNILGVPQCKTLEASSLWANRACNRSFHFHMIRILCIYSLHMKCTPEFLMVWTLWEVGFSLWRCWYIVKPSSEAFQAIVSIKDWSHRRSDFPVTVAFTIIVSWS